MRCFFCPSVCLLRQEEHLNLIYTRIRSNTRMIYTTYITIPVCIIAYRMACVELYSRSVCHLNRVKETQTYAPPSTPPPPPYISIGGESEERALKTGVTTCRWGPLPGSFCCTSRRRRPRTSRTSRYHLICVHSHDAAGNERGIMCSSCTGI